MTNQSKLPGAEKPAAGKQAPPGTEAAEKGGADPAKRPAEHDWQASAKEDGE